MSLFLRHIELWLSGLGLIIIYAVPTLLSPALHEPWKTAAITATVVGALHGLIFWAVRHRQRAVRNQAIRDITQMLQDRINNDLAVIMMNVSSSPHNPDAASRLLRSTQERVQRISHQVRHLSEESLQAWKGTQDTSELAR